MRGHALTVCLVGLLMACSPASEEPAPEASSPPASGAAVPADPEAPANDAVLVHDGGDDEVSVLIDGDPEDLERVRVMVGTDHVGWRDAPARLGPLVGIARAVEPLDVTLAYPPGVTGDLDADGLLVVAETSPEDLDFLDPVWDDARGAFVVDVTVRPDEYPHYVLLDRAAHAALFE